MSNYSHSSVMVRSVLAFVLIIAFTVAALVLRSAVQYRRHGDSGWRFTRASGAASITHVLMAGSALLLLAGPLAALVLGGPERPGGWRPLAASGTLAGGASLVAGVTACAVGAAMTLVAQLQMGASWRIGVDPSEQTQLITGGLFRHVRNPIFTGMGLFVLGQTLLVPNVVMFAAVIAGAAGLQGQVRLVEEPYLAASHGQTYRDWAALRGRFLPGVGKALR